MNGCAKPRRPPPSSSSSSSSSPRCSSTQTRAPVGSSPRPPPPPPPGPDHRIERLAAVPLAAAALASCPGPGGDVVQRGYLGKLHRNHRRYFVLRAGSHTGPGRLEWHATEEKFAAVEKSGKAAQSGSGKQRVIYLRCCFGVSRMASSRKGHTVALYAKDQTLVLVAEDQGEQEEWYLAIKKLIEEERRDGENGGELDEEDDGYCTLPPVPVFREVWPVTVKPRGLGRTKSLAGETRLCLSAASLVLVKVGTGGETPPVSLPLLSVRRFGHTDGSFFLELGRSAPNGPGEIWMEAGDQGDPSLAQHMHEAVREAMRALRALPDFSCSPTSNHQNQPRAQLASKRGRPKCREKVGPLASPLSPPSRSPGQTTTPASATQHHLEPRRPEKTDPESNLSPLRSGRSSVHETGSYVEMTMRRHLPVCKVTGDQGGGVSTEDHCNVPAGKVEGWGVGEVEGPGYMMMSPQDGRCCRSASPQDDYMTMASPHRRDRTSSTLQTSFNNSTSYNYSALHQSNHPTNEPKQPEATQSEMLIVGCSSLAQGDDARQEQEVAECRRVPVQAPGVPAPLPLTGPGNSRPVQANPIHASPVQANLIHSRPVQASLIHARPVQASLIHSRPVQVSLIHATPVQANLIHSRPVQASLIHARPVQASLIHARPVQAVPGQGAVRRYRLSSCLPSCLQAELRP